MRLHLDTVQNFLGLARSVPAALVIDTQTSPGPLVRPWRSLAQGGEAPAYQFTPVLPKLQALQPEYIRLDHIYDFYEPMTRTDAGTLQYDWSKLDALLNQITVAGAKPFLSLSYLPPTLANGDITGIPQSWSAWQALVQATIEHVSGTSGLNLTDVYYEVWNEPDLFGRWKTYGDKDYLTLYLYAARGAAAAKNVQPFRFGGPATSALYDNWLSRFFNHAAQNQLRLDFYSWHQYSAKPAEFFDDLVKFYKFLQAYPQYFSTVEPIISEWGLTSENHPFYDTEVAAAHTVATMSLVTPAIKHAFVFEIQDGKDPAGQEFWGRWGLLTHQDFGSREKPRYQALRLLNRLGPERLDVSGFGTYVKALAAKDAAGAIQLLVTNYDPDGKNTETVPIQFTHLTPGAYHLTTEFLGRLPSNTLLATTGATLSHSLPLAPNATALLTLSPQ
ncbi:hypothetical protein A2W24_01395 [Microgenomates group bacterium RBG_16_45_19]|nr:MAG: hypothetical protein A2W24_01395 [Microgenomates group bacterium RBG_16_45_19]